MVLYNIGIRVYHLGILIASLFDRKARLWIAGRKNLFVQLHSAIGPSDQIIWFHCSSLGEFEQGRPVIEKIREVAPEKKILLTFYSPSGYEIRKDFQGVDYIFYLPLDTRNNAQRFIRIVKPEMVYFIKYEYWYHFLKELEKNQTHIYLISAIFRKDQIFFKWYGKWFRRMLKSFNHLFVQDDDSKQNLAHIGITNVTVSGDTRFDRVFSIAGKSKQYPGIEAFTSGMKSLIMGSTWPGDEELLIRYINENSLPLKFIIAPHEVHESNIRRIENRIEKRTIRYSNLENSDPETADVLVIDTIGILSSVYQYGTVAYIGGGFGKGIHNILEAATFGLPVIFGPHFSRFKEAHDLIHLGAAFSVSNYDELHQNLTPLITRKNILQLASDKARNYVVLNKGVTDKIIAGTL
ncbi:MAG: 3-deoxy-D-manno-octulosonic acid transferase [Bacteroidales bacterium]|nr:3-deoxy-D-manno-octulosonic acid transferase [Bacteroidales bacterium]